MLKDWILKNKAFLEDENITAEIKEIENEEKKEKVEYATFISNKFMGEISWYSTGFLNLEIIDIKTRNTIFLISSKLINKSDYECILRLFKEHII